MGDRVDALVDELSAAEKRALLAGVDMWHVPGVERAGIPALKMTDGPNGARGAFMTDGEASHGFPCGSALGASWDLELVRRVGVALGEEARSKGAHVLLAPTVNIHRHPLAGRNFECFSEDPFLSSRMAVAYVEGVQSTGVAACVKHLVGNDSEYERMTISSEIGARALREVYLAPFEAGLLEAGAWSVMAAYNRLHGTWCSEHPWLLTTLLRDEWGWDGAVISDWYATHSEGSLAAGLDVEMPGPTLFRGAEAAISDDAVDTAARRIIRLAERSGCLDGVGAGQTERFDDGHEIRGLLREAAAAGMVLLRNEGDALPIDPADVKSIAVIGPNADALHHQGGGSAALNTPPVASPLDGLRVALRETGVDVRYALGAARARPQLVDARCLRDGGFRLEYFASLDLSGPVKGTALARRSRFVWMEAPHADVPDGGWSMRASSVLVPREGGGHTFHLRSVGPSRLVVDGAVVIDRWEGSSGRPRQATVALAAGAGHEIVLEVAGTGRGPFSNLVDLSWSRPVPDGALEQAVSVARDSDVAVVVVGLDDTLDSEGEDRPDMDLPAGQDELVRAVAAVNPRTIVVVNAGSPVAMPWAGDVAAVLWTWCPGEEGAAALADVVLGVVEPGGRLPTTLPVRLADTPAYIDYPGEAGAVAYGEGVFVGYRWYDRRRIAPAFPFGHGLGYTTFDVEEVRADRSGVDVTVRNAGARRGGTVVQVYVGDPESTVARPDKELKGFARVRDVAPGESTTVRIVLDERAFSFWDAALQRWRIEGGRFDVSVGFSAADLRRTVPIDIPSP